MIESMKALSIILACSFVSCLIMVVIDYLIGPKAQFLNAWSIVERLMGRTPIAGKSMIAEKFGSAGELIAVLAIHLLLGLIIGSLILHWLGRHPK